MKREFQELTEPKAQRYRAIAVFKNERIGLVFVGSSVNAVDNSYESAFHELYGKESDEDKTNEIREIQIQKWEGQAAAGRWSPVKTLPVPEPVSLPVACRRRPTTPQPTPNQIVQPVLA